MSDSPNGTASQQDYNYFQEIRLDGLRFPITDTPFLNMLSKGPSPYSRPIIGHTPVKQPQRWFWSRVCRVGHFLNDHLARFEHHEGDNDYDYNGPEEYWLKKDWGWLESAGARSKAAMPQPIYDPDWVRPAPRRTVTWGFGSPEPTD